MPALWQASQRPMFVRTVWVDGFRHAILTHDDPYYAKLKKKRPHSSASTTQYSGYSSKISRHKREDSGRLSLVVTNDRSNFINRQIEPEIEKLNLNDIDQESEEGFALKVEPQHIYEYESNRLNFDSLGINMRAFKSNRTARSEKENTDLSDRVLQWLDLAGKIDLLAPDNVDRMTQPRHSWPEIQKRNLSKSKTVVDDVKVKEEMKTPNDSARTQTSVDRRDYHVPPSAGTIENYARQSRNKVATRDAGKKTTKRDIRVNVLEARQKVVAERNAIKKQYAELVSKKLIPDLGKGKKQVHIFMPETIKKNSMTGRAESLLSQASQRPMFVHTVWVDGFRHAILTNDDPHIAKLKERKPCPSASASRYAGYTGKISRSQKEEARRVNLIIKNDKSNFVERYAEQSVDKLYLNDIDQDSETSYALKPASQQLYNQDSTRSSYNSLGINLKAFRSDKKPRSDKPNPDVSHKVVQWLDVAGENVSTPGEVQVQPRYSWPVMQKQNLSKSITDAKLRAEEEAKLRNNLATALASIDHHSYHAKSFATTVENYARQSRYKMATRDSGSTTNRDVRGNVLSARKKAAAETKFLEKQHANIFSVRKMTPDMREAKKPVHVVLPEPVKKKSMMSGLESLLSQMS